VKRTVVQRSDASALAFAAYACPPPDVVAQRSFVARLPRLPPAAPRSLLRRKARCSASRAASRFVEAVMTCRQCSRG